VPDATVDASAEAGASDDGASATANPDASPPPPRCAGGPDAPGAGNNCGFSGTDDCCASNLVDTHGLVFYRDYASTDPNTGAPATVSSFRLDRYEVTVGRFRAFVEAASAATPAWAPDAGTGKHTHLNGGKGLTSGGDAGPPVYEEGWNAAWSGSWLPTSRAAWDADLMKAECQVIDIPGVGLYDWSPDAGTPKTEALPINCVTWYEAYAFCIWDGGFLPSDAELNFAAAGGARQFDYAWNGEFVNSPLYAVVNCNYPGQPFGGSAECKGLTNIADVGFAWKGQGVWGQFDLTGSVSEYVLDYGSPSGLQSPNPCNDCAAFVGGTDHTDRINRGGGWDSALNAISNDVFDILDPTEVSPNVGVRCARAP
jgi:formylglycine-generating enzyme required for sulfatase activity